MYHLSGVWAQVTEEAGPELGSFSDGLFGRSRLSASSALLVLSVDGHCVPQLHCGIILHFMPCDCYS